jgi:hypothetical protein
MTLEETEAVLEDLQLTAGFSRLALSEIRYQRAQRLNALREGAKGSVTQEWGSFATNEDGSAKTQNQIESDIANRVSLGDALRANGLGNKLRSLREWSSTTRKMNFKSFISEGALFHLGRLSNEVGEFFRDQIYKPMGVMEEAVSSMRPMSRTKGPTVSTASPRVTTRFCAWYSPTPTLCLSVA